MADTLGPPVVLAIPSAVNTLGPTLSQVVPTGSLTLGPFTRLDMPVGPLTIGPLAEVTVWEERPKLLRIEQTRAPMLGLLRIADLNSTVDQPIIISAKKYVIRRIVVTGANAAVTTATGGLYTGPGKTGTAIVPAAQTYSALSTSSKFVVVSLHASVSDTVFTGGTLYLSLTTPEGVSVSASVYIYGDSVEP